MNNKIKVSQSEVTNFNYGDQYLNKISKKQIKDRGIKIVIMLIDYQTLSASEFDKKYPNWPPYNGQAQINYLLQIINGEEI